MIKHNKKLINFLVNYTNRYVVNGHVQTLYRAATGTKFDFALHRLCIYKAVTRQIRPRKQCSKGCSSQKKSSVGPTQHFCSVQNSFWPLHVQFEVLKSLCTSLVGLSILHKAMGILPICDLEPTKEQSSARAIKPAPASNYRPSWNCIDE